MARVFTTSFLYKGETYTAIMPEGNRSGPAGSGPESQQPLLPGDEPYQPEATASQLADLQQLAQSLLAAVDAVNALPGETSSPAQPSTEC